MSLISPKLRLYFKKGILHGQTVHSHPYTWNHTLNRPEPCKSKLKLYMWCVNVAVTAFYSLFVFTRCVQVNLDESGKYGPVRKIYMQCIVFYYAFPALFQIGLVFKRTDTPIFFQQNVNMMDQLGGKIKMNSIG